MSECLFCKLIAGGLNAKIVADTDELLAFLDINPQAPTHILIITKRHIAGLAACEDSDSELLGKIQLLARDIAKKHGLEKGWRLVTNNGRGAGTAGTANSGGVGGGLWSDTSSGGSGGTGVVIIRYPI